MNHIFGFFLLFSILTTGLIIHSSSLLFPSDDLMLSFDLPSTAFAEEQVNTTTYSDTNSTSITLNDTMKIDDNSTGSDDTNSTSITLNDTMKIGDNVMTPKDVLSPLKQIKNGVISEDVVCKQDLQLTFKLDGQAACVKITSIEKLISRGWTR